MKKGEYKDITGQKFGRLTALYRLHNTKGRMSKWLCICDCGNLSEVFLNSLTRGLTKSCGCLNKERISKRSKTHGKRNTKLYSVWCHIKQRCYNKNTEHYEHYGGRGIKMYHEWKNNFQVFYNWAVDNGYKDNLTIDRIDVNGNYEPNNCRWVDMKQQQRNRRNNRNFTHNGETHCLMEWCEILGISRNTVYSRLRRGCTIEKALELEG